jgi:hypothetical protein
MPAKKLKPGFLEVPGPGGQQRLTKWFRVSAPKANLVATKAAKSAAIVAIDIDCIDKCRKLGSEASGNSR